MSKRIRKKDARLMDAAAWLSRRRDAFPDGFTAQSINAMVEWERARYFGIVKLKNPEQRMVVQMPNEDRAVMRSMGMHDFSKVTVFQKRIGPRRSCYDAPELVPSVLRGSPSGIGRVLSSLAKIGSIEEVPGSRPKAYRCLSRKLVFGQDRADDRAAARKREIGGA